MLNPLDFTGKVALVTDAGMGMGLVTANAFAAAGAAVALTDVDEKAVGTAAVRLVAAGHKAIAVRCNVADKMTSQRWSNEPLPLLAASTLRSTMLG